MCGDIPWWRFYVALIADVLVALGVLASTTSWMLVLSAPADSDAPDLRPLHFIGPIEGIRTLGLELVVQPARIVVVDDHHCLPADKAVEGTKDGRVLVARCNHPHVEF
jgi:hypothetical protein